jgi:hypothetical protein
MPQSGFTPPRGASSAHTTPGDIRQVLALPTLKPRFMLTRRFHPDGSVVRPAQALWVYGQCNNPGIMLRSRTTPDLRLWVEDCE